MSAHYFVADAHIGAGRPDGAERLCAFLGSIRGKADSLYILGDLFEFWLEYRRVIPRQGFGVMTQLSELRRAGTRLVYLKGNHDFLVGDFFRGELGVAAVYDEVEAVIDGRKVHLCHGDALDKGFVPRLFRGLMRSRTNAALYSLLHPDVGVWLAHRVAARSRELGVKPYLAEAMVRHAQSRIDAGCDYVMMAHSHVPETRRLGRGLYINIGDWVRSFTYGVIRDGAAALEHFTG